MILEVDIGNSSVKWRLRQEGEIVARGASLRNSNSGIDFDLLFLECARPQVVCVSSVVASVEKKIHDWCLREWDLIPFMAKVTESFAGVTNGYERVEQMGVDRWLAMIAAYSQVGRECLVIDIGSACTVDLVLSNGHHAGGYIVPGLKLMKDALFRDTDRVKLDAIENCRDIEPGRTTELAVSSGLWSMIDGLVLNSLHVLLKRGAVKPEIFLTGGDAENMAALLQGRVDNRELPEISGVRLSPDLVLDGLSLVFSKI